MELFILSKSDSVIRHIESVFPKKQPISFLESVEELLKYDEGQAIVLVHADSFKDNLLNTVSNISETGRFFVGVASNEPVINEFLRLSLWDISAYFNSYMANTHYKQMVKLVSQGQNWIHPGILQQVIRKAGLTVQEEENQQAELNKLTRREKQVAESVAEGLSNKEISILHGITERTVKAHLTKIFGKLNVKDRVSLAILMSKKETVIQKRA